ncbi:hypothetical protein LR48_Vigan06g118600 [Vigna angularis]|uniref:3'-5' exonuclease domain-containing protein n=3 Tax=Phaseolus angularis TaxID=3914 RepID=A0A0L9USM4_PHAAN|nr:3'-5' exonuclease isoform X1 [Vigna angularis]KAG2376952.1 uncharacterized protein HKW66_Vig0175250 [Vigna angularis]KOM45880.1 hypothetical protein LR48_Vigan06g118600 [Vigna angularis]BAT99104.1 hypothetical protein VIGAN_10048900 [Vigna angularis var. angularis]
MTLNDRNMVEPSTRRYEIWCDGTTIETIVTNEENIVEQWLSSTYALKQKVVGLDTEWMHVPKASTKKATMKVAILQLCVEDRCLIVQLFFMKNIPPSLQSFMMDASFDFVGVGVMNDINMLKKNYGLECNKGTDLVMLAKKRWPEKISSGSLKYLAKELVGLEMEKSKAVVTSDWKAKELTEVQVKYACIDAYASFKIGKMVLSD